MPSHDETSKRLTSDLDACDDASAKRPKTKSAGFDFHNSFSSAFAPDLFSRACALAEQYKVSAPYLHACINRLVDDSLLRDVRKEIFSEIAFTAKETDIYKVNQTGDLKNLDGLPASELSHLPSVFRLRNALYSPEFREFVSTVTGCGALSGSMQDLSINNYTEGCHLLCHDDVIGTRRVSYILYLVDEDWDLTHGGALELYPCISEGTPAVDPTLTIPPRWNQFVMFTVQPGASFHSVQEVMAKNKSRLSISGWFHFPLPGEPGYVEGAADANAQASLLQLEGGDQEEIPFNNFSKLPDSLDSLSNSDLEYLSKYINPDYLRQESLEKISSQFAEESCVQLYNFLKPDLENNLHECMKEVDQMDGYIDQSSALIHGVGVHEPWFVTGDPVKHRYLTFNASSTINDSSSASRVAKLLQELQKNIFESTSFRKFLAIIGSMVPISYRGIARRFRPGLDYTLATTSKIVPVLDTTLCFAIGDKPLWESQDFGGYECYVGADTDDFDPAIYRGASENEGALITAAASWNCLMIVLRDEDVLRFVKYVSGRAPGSRWDLSYEYDVRDN